jgi:nicotinamidase/pyrazinamidase
VTTVFFDIDTQIDFLYPAGALYVPGAERVVPAIARLNRWAAAHGVTVVSTMDAHTEDDPEFRDWPAHCVAGTAGQSKPAATLAGQMIFEKQTTDLFRAPGIEALLGGLNADRYVVYGVVTEICVAHAARGLLKTGKPVAIVTDAVETLAAENAERFYAEFTAAGGTLTTVADVCAGD